MSILQAVEKILKEAKKPLSAEELTTRIVEQGFWTPKTKTPIASVGAAVYDDVKKKGAKSRFVKVGNGYFALAKYAGKAKANDGYVYILTHPCFIPDIIKIGKTQGAVEDRAKQLFTTALPKEFDIYATLKTSKFSETEELIHDYFNSKRINPKREFFHISPKEALALFYKVKRLLADGEITEDFKRAKPFEDEDKADMKKGAGMTDRQKLILSFWTAFNKYAEKNEAFLQEFSLRKPGKYCYYDFAINRGTYHVFMRVTSKKGTILTGIYCSKDKPTYEAFLAQREEIDKALGEKTNWNWATQDGAFSLVKNFDIAASKDSWPVAFKWFCDTAIKFREIDQTFGK